MQTVCYALSEADHPKTRVTLRPRIEQLLGLLAHRDGARESRYMAAPKTDCKQPVLPRSATSTRPDTDSPSRTREMPPQPSTTFP